MATAITAASVDAKALAGALRLAQPFVPRSIGRLRLNGTPDALWVQAGDGRTFVQIPVPCEGAGDIDVTVDGRVLVKALPRTGEASLAAEDDRLVVAHAAGRSTVPAHGLVDLPRFAWGEIVEGATFVSVDPEPLRHVICAAARDDIRPLLACVEVAAHEGGVRLTATDSYRLHTHQGEPLAGDGPPADLQMSLPTGLLRPLLKGSRGAVEGVSLARAADGWGAAEVFRKDGTVIQGISRLVDGTYPQWESLLPGDGDRLLVDQPTLAAASAATAQVRGEGVLTLSIEPDAPRVLRLHANGREGSIEQTADLLHPVASMQPTGANPTYFAEAAAAMGGGVASLDYTSPLRPILLTSEDGRTRALVMPIRLQG